jgi:late embryogenesis abundant protein
MRRMGLIAFWLGALPACTPLGFWVYGDPAFEVSRVRLAAEPASDSTVLVAIDVWNPNDYDLSTTRIELQLRLDGKRIGNFRRDSIIPVPQLASATLSLPFVAEPDATPAQLAAFRSGTHQFQVEGKAILQTPFGDRHIRVVHAGKMAFGGGVEPASGTSGSETRPGAPIPAGWPAAWRLPTPPSTPRTARTLK